MHGETAMCSDPAEQLRVFFVSGSSCLFNQDDDCFLEPITIEELVKAMLYWIRRREAELLANALIGETRTGISAGFTNPIHLDEKQPARISESQIHCLACRTKL